MKTIIPLLVLVLACTAPAQRVIILPLLGLVLACTSRALRVIVGGLGSQGEGMERFRGQRMRVFLDGRPIRLTTDPIVHGDELYVPIRGVFERFGARLTYSKRSKTVFARRGKRTVSARVGTKLARVNGQNRLLDAPPMLRNRRILIPFRFFADALGAGVIWRPDENRLEILSDRGASAPRRRG